jgi:hypothetical protein
MTTEGVKFIERPDRKAHAMLSGTRVRPPQLDEFFSAEEVPLRAIDFGKLGWTEDMIWDA